MQGLSGLAGPQAAQLGAKIGLSPEQVSQVLGHLGGQASAGITDPHAAARATAAHTGIDPAMIQGVIGALTASGGAGGLVNMLDRNHDGSVVDDVMGMASGFLGRK